MSRKDSILFSQINVGHQYLKNRFMRSATNEFLGNQDGTPKKELASLYQTYAENNVGLIVSGNVFVTSNGRRGFNQPGMATTKHAEAWKPITANLKKTGAKFIYQLSHVGATSNRDCAYGRTVGVPSYAGKNTHEMTIAEIEDTIELFRNSAEHAYRSGADGVQLHAAHGYLLSSFLSPATNKRTDKYGGSPENRLRIVKEIVNEIRGSLPPSFMLSIKMNGNDHREDGNTPEDAAWIVSRLAHDVDLFEISAGLGPKMFSMRTDVSEKWLTRRMPADKAAKLLKAARKATEGAEFIEDFNIDACKVIRNKNPHVRLALVGGLRTFSRMEEIVSSGVADVVSISRPLLRDPALITRYLEGLDKPSCINCSTCLFRNQKGVYCHVPADKK